MSSTAPPLDPLDKLEADLDEFERLLPRVQAKLSERPSAPRRSIADFLGGTTAGVQFADATTASYRSR